MKRRISLYIDGRKADLSDDSLVLWTWTREQLGSPAVVKNAYTKQVTLPGTPANEAIFGHYGRLDRLTSNPSGGYGLDFNALKRTPFAIYDDTSALLESGYLKLDSVASDAKGVRSYKVTLYGGLGEFLYGLMYDADGKARTLASLWYWTPEAGVDPEDEPLYVEVFADDVKASWAYLKTADPDSLSNLYDVIGFAPAYNGIPPKEFDSQHSIQGAGSAFLPVPSGKDAPWDDGTYAYTLVSHPAKYTEWEMRDLRAYLQRPVVRLRAVIEALCKPYNNGGWTAVLDPTFFTKTNPFYSSSWITLPMLDVAKIRRDSHRQADKVTLLGTSMSPADVLLSLVKTFGLVIWTDDAAKEVHIEQRTTFYLDRGVKAVDLTDRVDTGSGIDISPLPYQNRFLLFKSDQYGTFAEEYAARYGRIYGSMRVDTGYDFNDAENDVLKDVAFKGAPEGQETSKYFCYIGASPSFIPSPMLDTGAKYVVKDHNSGDLEELDAPGVPASMVSYFDPQNVLLDLSPKVQLHGKENAAQGGDGVLLIYRGTLSLPDQYLYGLTDDHPAMDQLNNGTACWYPGYVQSGYGYNLAELPVFSRYGAVSGGYDYRALDFGVPAEVLPGVNPAATSGLYKAYWERYIADRYDADAKVMRCKVDLRGLEVGPKLLGRFFWYRGSVWSLNKITDYSLTTDDLTSCEFVKVQDVANYKNY